jgi:hypothetical protein
LAPRWFVIRNTRATSPPLLLQPRYAMSLMRGPMTRVEIQRARGNIPPLEHSGLGQGNNGLHPEGMDGLMMAK